MIIQKFNRLSRTYRKNPKVIRMFYEALIDASEAQEETKLDGATRDELAAAFLAKVAKVIEEPNA